MPREKTRSFFISRKQINLNERKKISLLKNRLIFLFKKLESIPINLMYSIKYIVRIKKIGMVENRTNSYPQIFPERLFLTLLVSLH